MVKKTIKSLDILIHMVYYTICKGGVNMEGKDEWKEKESMSIGNKPAKVPFNRYNLKKFDIANSKDYDKESCISVRAFLDFFDEDSLSKKDEETGCYISHLICMDGYLIARFWHILNYLFDNEIVSPYEINDKGQLFLDCMFQTKDSSNWFYITAYMDNFLSRYFININRHQDFNGNNLAHHLIVNCPGEYYKSVCMYLDQELFEMKNKNGISALDLRELSEKLWLSYNFYDKYFTIEETSSQIIITRYKWLYDAAKDRDSSHMTGAGFSFIDDIHIYPKDEILLKFLEHDKYKDVRKYFPLREQMDHYGFGSLNIKKIAKNRVKGKK